MFLDRIPGTGGPGTQDTAGTYNLFIPMDNMFLTSKEEDKKFEVFPEVVLRGPIYSVAPKHESNYGLFRPLTGQDLIQLVQRCRDLQTNPNRNCLLFNVLNYLIFLQLAYSRFKAR